MTASEAANLLSEFGFSASSEAVLHHAVRELLDTHGIEAKPEHALSARDRIDFYLPDGRTGIECKIDGSATAVMRQLLRYAESDQIEGLVLVTSRTKHRNMPPTLGGKPVYVVLTRAF